MAIWENEKVKKAFALHDVKMEVSFYNDVYDIPLCTEGIYFLWRKCGKLDYIGTSGGIVTRLCSHTVYSRKVHTIGVVEIDTMGIAHAIEINLVAILNPHRNKHGRTNIMGRWY